MLLAIPAAFALLSLAQPPAADKDKPADRTPPKVEIWTEARDVLEKELDLVRALKSTKGSVLAVWEYSVEGSPARKDEFTSEWAVQKPDKLFLENKLFKVYADGKTITVLSKFGKQYVQRPQPQAYLLRDTVEQMSGNQIASIPGEAILRPGMSLEQTLRGVKSVERARAGENEGMPGIWVTGTAIDDRQPGSKPFTYERWYSDEDHMLRLVKENWTDMYQDIANRVAADDSEDELTPKKPQHYISIGWTKTYKRELNPKLAPETFAFTPRPGDRQVEKIIFQSFNQTEQVAMIGKPCPPVIGKDFGGRDAKGKEIPPQVIDVASFKGKVVILDFWATWCGPCFASLPSMQAIKDKLADKPFMMIGVNRDHPSPALKVSLPPDPAMGELPDPAASKVLRYLARHNYTIQQLNDIQGKIADIFYTSNSIPLTVLIDMEGNIADIKSGYLPGDEKELAEKIDTLLAGKPLRTPEQLRELREIVAMMNAKGS